MSEQNYSSYASGEERRPRSRSGSGQRSGDGPRRPKKGRGRGGLALRVIGTLLLIAVTTGAILCCFGAVYVRTVILPKASLDLGDVTLRENSVMYYEDDSGQYQELGQVLTSISSQWVEYEEIPEDLKNAAIAIEDRRFLKHNGVDWWRTAQAVFSMFTGGDIQGGSTITQQLIKNLTEDNETTVKRKVTEIFRALEFDRNIHTETDFQLTSCCCPMWIGMIRKLYHELMPHVPGAVSPMIAAGRTVKKLHPDAVTIFVGPCIAKKAEAREADLAGAVDYVLTFQEMQDIFQAADIHPELLEESERDHSSRAGRIYARTGGVSEAVRTTVARLHPERPIQVRTRQADGVPACRAMIEDIRSGQHQANFFEGMGCTGGCVGGPKVLLDRETGRENVDRYGDEAEFSTPLDNPYVLKLLRLLGFDTVEEFLEQSDIFIRHF